MSLAWGSGHGDERGTYMLDIGEYRVSLSAVEAAKLAALVTERDGELMAKEVTRHIPYSHGPMDRAAKAEKRACLADALRDY